MRCHFPLRMCQLCLTFHRQNVFLNYKAFSLCAAHDFMHKLICTDERWLYLKHERLKLGQVWSTRFFISRPMNEFIKAVTKYIFTDHTRTERLVVKQFSSKPSESEISGGSRQQFLCINPRGRLCAFPAWEFYF